MTVPAPLTVAPNCPPSRAKGPSVVRNPPRKFSPVMTTVPSKKTVGVVGPSRGDGETPVIVGTESARAVHAPKNSARTASMAAVAVRRDISASVGVSKCPRFGRTKAYISPYRFVQFACQVTLIIRQFRFHSKLSKMCNLVDLMNMDEISKNLLMCNFLHTYGSQKALHSGAATI
jgi:hypothetical protein